MRTAGLLSALAITFHVCGQAPFPNPTPRPDPNAPTQNLPVIPAPINAAPPPATPPPESIGYVPAPPASDVRNGFSYAPSIDHEGFTVIYPTDGSDPLHVATSFLEVAIKSRGTDAQILQSARNYEQMNASMSTKFMDQFFPDSSAGNANVQQQAVQGAHQDVIIEQDPLAGPYARVTVTDKEGNIISQSSISAKAVAGIMGQPHLTAEQKIAALSRPDYTLPESARNNFDALNPEQFEALVLEKPELSKQEFIKAARVIAIEEQQKSERELTRGNTVTTSIDAPSSRIENGSNIVAAHRALPTTGVISGDADNTNAETVPDEVDASDYQDSLSIPSQPMLPWGSAAVIGLIAVGIFSFWFYRSRQ